MNDVTTIAVAGGGTGAGATTLLVALALRARAAGRNVTAVDADPCGGGIDVAFGIETEPGVRWEDLLGSDGPLDGERLVERLPGRDDGLRVLSFGREWCELPEELFGRAIQAVRGASELVLVDVGRHRWAPGIDSWADDVLLVARGSAAGLAGAGATAQRFEHVPRLVVRGMGEGAAYESARALGMDLAAVVPTDRRIAGDAERGLPAGSRGRSTYVGRCDALLRDLLLPARAVA